MAVGWPDDKTAINMTAGQLVFELRETLDKIGIFKLKLDGWTDQQLVDKGFTQADITLLRASYTDLDKLRQVAHAQAQQVGTNDFFWNAKYLTGVR